MRMRPPKIDRALAGLALAAALAACSKEPAPKTDAGVPANTCASASQASGNSDCNITAGQDKQAYLAPDGDPGWFVLDLPAPLPARPLLSVTASYGANAKRTPVVLAINVLSSDGKSSIGHAQADPAHGVYDAQLVTRISAAGRYFVQVSNAPGADAAKEARFPYTLSVKLVSDPDLNEPNDDTPTPVTLAGCEQDLVLSGAFTTPGDRDKFTFDVPATPCTSGGRTLLYIRAVETAAGAAQAVRLFYSLTGPATVEGDSENRSAGQKAVSAIVAPAGKYQLLVINRKDSSPEPMDRGDLTFTYQVTVRIYGDKDQNEGTKGNDTLDNATNVPLALNSPVNLTGGLAYRGDQDIFKVQNSTGAPTRLHYKVKSWAASGTARFEPLTTGIAKTLSVFEKMNSAAECEAQCPGDEDFSLRAAECHSSSRCLWHLRTQDLRDPATRDVLNPVIVNFENFEGQIYIPTGGARYLRLWYDGGAGADDTLYTLELNLLAATEPALHDSIDSAIAVGAGSAATTSLGWGFGRIAEYKAPNVDLLRTYLLCLPDQDGNRHCTRDYSSSSNSLLHEFKDYDAASQIDFFQVSFAGSSADRSLNFGWTLPNAAGASPGSRPYDIQLTFYFESSDGQKWRINPMAYTADPGYPWYSSYPSGVEKPWFTFDRNAGRVDVTPDQCVCIDAAYAATGRFWVEVQAINRTSYADSTATLDLNVGAYPSGSCPSPCKFVDKLKQKL